MCCPASRKISFARFLLFVIVVRTFEARTRVKLEIYLVRSSTLRERVPSIIAVIGQQHVHVLLRSIHFLAQFAYFSTPAIQCVWERKTAVCFIFYLYSNLSMETSCALARN